MAGKPIRVFYSELNGRFYATKHYRIDEKGIVTVIGEKFDVTNDIGAIVTTYDLEFTPRKGGN